MTDVGRPTVKVLWTCHKCSSLDIPLTVPARVDHRHPVGGWIEMVRARVGAAHTDRSPSCTATTLHDIKLPIGGSKDKNEQWVGGPAVT